MPTDQTELIKTALEEYFDRVLGQFDGINMLEHRSETLCFVGLESYTLKDAVCGTSGAKRPAEAVYAVRVLSRRGQTAEELEGQFDADVVPAVEAAVADLREIKRKPCVYLKEQDRYCAAAEFITLEEIDSASAMGGVGLSIMSSAVPYMTHFELRTEIEVTETPVLNGSVYSAVLGRKPGKLSVWGNVPYSDISAVYRQLSGYVGQRIMLISIAGISLFMYTMTSVEVEGAVGGAKITAELSEVTQL